MDRQPVLRAFFYVFFLLPMTWYVLSARIHVSLKSGVGCPPSLALANPFFYYFASASVSLLDSLCPTAGDIDGLHSQFGPYDQILRHSLDRVPLLCSWIPPLHIGCGINTSNSIRQKLFEAPWPAIQCKTKSCTVCPSIHRPHYIFFQSPSYIVHNVGCHVSWNELQHWHGKYFLC